MFLKVREMAGFTNLFNFSAKILYQKVHHDLLSYFFLRNYGVSTCMRLSSFTVRVHQQLGLSPASLLC